MNKLRELFSQDQLYVAPGVYNGLSAKLVEQAGFPIVYASGGAIARSTGVPDMGLISFTQIVETLAQIVDAVSIPVIADFDNGYGNAVNARYAIKAFERSGVAAVHMEDQQLPKRCGHLSGKHIVSTNEFEQKIKAVKDAASKDFYLIARTDAIAVEGFESALERGHRYIDAGADMLFIEAPTTIEQIEIIGKELPYPKLLNMFYSGKTPIVPLAQLKSWGYNLVIDPSDLQRASIYAMQETLKEVKRCGHSEGIKDRLVSFKDREKIIGTEKYLELSDKYS
jgi:2-methylisocitrate lyase-like PEP mutase family enzyme